MSSEEFHKDRMDSFGVSKAQYIRAAVYDFILINGCCSVVFRVLSDTNFKDIEGCVIKLPRQINIISRLYHLERI